MKTLNQIQIEKLRLAVETAQVNTPEGRQVVANSCKELYNIIEEDIYNAGKEWMLKGMYNDLCNGNFAEPFYCDLKKGTFAVVVQIYKNL